MKKYDVIIVGAGPAGIFAAYELTKQHNSLKILLIDKGARIKNRKRSNVMCGFGGAGAFSDGKLLYTPILSFEKALHLINKKNYQKLLDYIDDIFTKFGVTGTYYPTNQEEVNELIKKAQRKDIELVVRKTQHAGTDKLKNVLYDIETYLEKENVEILANTEITKLITEDKSIKGVKSNKNDKYLGEKVLLAPGRVGTRWLQKILKKYKVKYTFEPVEVGVRVEFPAAIMEELSKVVYEPIFRLRTQTYDDIIRTFCCCPNGKVAIEDYDDYICVNGHSNSKYDSPNSNFAFVCETKLTEPVENTIEYAKSIAKVTSTIGGDKPILQRLHDLKSGRRSTWNRIKKSIVTPSLTDVTPGDISMSLPHRIITNILEGLEKLDRMMPGIKRGSTLLYAPEVKYRSSKVKTNEDLQTSLKGLYVAGDASGLSGTITGAASTGIMAARRMKF